MAQDTVTEQPRSAKDGFMRGKRGLVMGVANDHSIAWGIARALAAEGAELAFTYQGEALGKRVKPLAQSVGSDLVLPCDVERLDTVRARGGAMVTLTFGGATRVTPNYNVMGVAKAALEASVRYLAADYGAQGLRVNAISAGPVRTLAGAGITDARFMYNYHRAHAPLRRPVTIADVGGSASSRMMSPDFRFSGRGIPTMLKPPSTKWTSPVTPRDRSDRR